MTKHTDVNLKPASSEPRPHFAGESSDQPVQQANDISSHDSQHFWLNGDSIVDTVREPLLVLSADLRVRKANRSFYRTFEVTPDETVGQLIYNLGNQQWDIPWLRRLLEEVLPKDTAFDDFEVDHVFPGIGRKFMLLNARRICRQDNQAEFILLAIEDMTARRQAEDGRREMETRYTSLVKNIKDHSIFMMDLEGNITTWNAEAERIIGFSESEILGRSFSVIFTPEDLQGGLPAKELRLAREEGRAEDERWHVRKDGSRFWALGIVTPMHNAGGNLTGYSKILRDMTERKCVELQLAEQALALKQAEQRKDQFLATLAHELRNPLAPIRNSLQIMKMPCVDAATVERSREMMEWQVHQLVRLVDDLMDVSRFVQGKIELRKERVELAAVVARAVETAQPVIDAQGHNLTILLPPDSMSLEGDRVRLAGVLSNLLTNAAKYTEPGGRIWLTAQRKDDEAVLRVKDNGIGIAPDMLSRVFDLFVQVDYAATRSQGGLGIGLTLVRDLIVLHGGTIEAHSAGLGKGSEFVVRLPLRAQTPKQSAGLESAEPRQPSPSPGYRLLVVDDNKDAAESLAMLLRLHGHEVRAAHDGPVALEMTKDYRPDLVFLDIGMPQMDGYEVARRLRQQPGLENVMLAALTGWGQENDRRRSMEAGFDYHFVKPMEPKTLETLLADFRLPNGKTKN